MQMQADYSCSFPPIEILGVFDSSVHTMFKTYPTIVNNGWFLYFYLLFLKIQILYMKLFFYDLETTGLDSQKNAIHQMSGKIVIDGVEKTTFNFKVRPFIGALIDETALKIGHVTEEQIMLYPSCHQNYIAFVTLIQKYVNRFDTGDKFHLVGYNNASFDNHFLRNFFKVNKDDYFGSYFWSDSIDVMVLASHYLKNDRHNIYDFKLKTVAKWLKIEVDAKRLHDAEYDIELTEKIYNIIDKA
jgi:DNA polymerase-3 subunit epsilon